jgi:hypothetical protein
MAFTILEVIGPEPAGLRVRARHEDSVFVALLVSDRPVHVHDELRCEMDYEAIASTRTLPDFADESSGIRQGEGDTIVIRGRVHQVLAEEKDTLIDLYLMNGPEFFLFRASDAGTEVPAVGVGLEVVVHGLRILLPSRQADAGG